MSLTAGSRLGPYEILFLLGAGGMGEVYKARDTRLDRTVAIKILQSADPHQQQRFEREARAISALDHPHICALHDVQEASGQHFLIMQYVDGETLADRLQRGALPLDQALRYAIEIADALAHAHRFGIVHRDLKPANIMFTKSGVKLLDFGLAKLQEPAAQPVAASIALTKNPGLTAEGTILGTLHYMAPEQLEGKEADARSDLFAFGAVLYEMVTGVRPFDGKSSASVIAAILETTPPPIASRQPLVPQSLDHVVMQCLAKEPDQRWQAASDVAHELRWIAEVGFEDQPQLTRSPRNIRAAVIAFGAMAAGTILIAAVWSWSHAPSATSSMQVIRSSISLHSRLNHIAVSPDGTRLAYVVEGAKNQIYLRALAEFDAKPVAGTVGAELLFFSPDSRWLGFWADGKLRKVAVSGGAPQVICDSTSSFGATWGTDDTIVFASDTATGLSRVSANGGTPQVVTTPDRAKHEKSHRFPHFLPNSKSVLFTITLSTASTFDESKVALLSLESGRIRVLLDGGTTPMFIPTGHLLYVGNTSLLAVPFDDRRLEVTGPAIPVIDAVSTAAINGEARVGVADSGLLAYVPGAVVSADRRVVLVDREGHVEPVIDTRRAVDDVRVSADGQRLALTILGTNDHVWIYELTRRTLTRLTHDWDNHIGGWTGDGQRVLFSSDRDGPFNLYLQEWDGSSPAQRLTEGSLAQGNTRPLPDGNVFAFVTASPNDQRGDIWLYDTRSRRARPLVQTPFDEEYPTISPDGRWIAYTSDESGQAEVYVQAFPQLGGKRQISTDGGVAPAWDRHGRELYYHNRGRMIAVTITTGPSLVAATPRVLFAGAYEPGYDVAPDGRFIMIEDGPSETSANELAIVQNWFTELQQRIPRR